MVGVIFLEKTGMPGEDGNPVVDVVKKVVEEQVPRDLFIPEEEIRLKHQSSEHPEPQPDSLGACSIGHHLLAIPQIANLLKHFSLTSLQANSITYELL